MGRSTANPAVMFSSSPDKWDGQQRRKTWRCSCLWPAIIVWTVWFVTIGTNDAGAANPRLIAAGSPTTQSVMSKVLATAVDNVGAGSTSGGAPAGTANCIQGHSYSASNPAPESSAAAVSALAEEEFAAPDERGCVAVARSSSPPSVNGPIAITRSGTHLQYFAFALDGIAPLVGSDSGATPTAPASLTMTQIRAVYDCTITRWSGLGISSDAAIVRYWPSAGSATASLYADVLGFNPTQYTTSDHCHNDLTGSHLVQAGTEDQIIADGDEAQAFFLYTAGRFTHQWNHPKAFGPTKSNGVDESQPNAEGNWSSTLTLANVQDLGGQAFHSFVDYRPSKRGRGTESLDTTTVTEANEWFFARSDGATIVPGVFYLYNVVDTALPMYQAALGFVGFTASSPLASPLCSGDESSKIIAAGFVPLTAVPVPTETDQRTVTCRMFTGGSES